MKTIIKKATKKAPDEWIYKKKCKVCKCVFTYELNDVYGWTEQYITCPSCRYSNDIWFNHKYKIKENK